MFQPRGKNSVHHVIGFVDYTISTRLFTDIQNWSCKIGQLICWQAKKETQNMNYACHFKSKMFFNCNTCHLGLEIWNLGGREWSSCAPMLVKKEEEAKQHHIPHRFLPLWLGQGVALRSRFRCFRIARAIATMPSEVIAVGS
jgi:hypothetical protein